MERSPARVAGSRSGRAAGTAAYPGPGTLDVLTENLLAEAKQAIDQASLCLGELQLRVDDGLAQILIRRGLQDLEEIAIGLADLAELDARA